MEKSLYRGNFRAFQYIRNWSAAKKSRGKSLFRGTLYRGMTVYGMEAMKMYSKSISQQRSILDFFKKRSDYYLLLIIVANINYIFTNNASFQLM